ncbi:MAG: hypothetical protein HY332_01185 [Chloroflexi bacterium]|nr:hypothetical protein [Chloroflexota bacterium]
MTTKNMQGTQHTSAAEKATPAKPGRKAAQPGPWDAPWHHKEDSTGWETVYRGTGQRREITSSLVLELTPEQNEWVDRAAEAGGVTPHAIIRQLIDDARAADEAEQAVASETPKVGVRK